MPKEILGKDRPGRSKRHRRYALWPPTVKSAAPTLDEGEAMDKATPIGVTALSKTVKRL